MVLAEIPHFRAGTPGPC